MLNKFLLFGMNRRLAVFLLLSLVTFITGAGLKRLTIDTGFSGLIADSDPNMPFYDQIAQEFGSDNRTVIYIRDSKLWSPEKLAVLEKLHYTLASLKFVSRVDDIFTLRVIRGKDDKIESRVILSEAPTNQEVSNQALSDAIYNPLIAGNFVSGDGFATAIMISVQEENNNGDFDLHISRTIDRVLSPVRKTFQEVFQVGPTRINTDLKKVLFHDLRILGPLSALVLVAGILFFLRSWFAALVPLITSALSLSWTFGMMGWTGIPINILCAMLPSMVVVIGSTEDIHMIASYFHGISLSQEDHRRFATSFMIKHMGMPLFLTILTTAMGFASNIFSGIGIIRDFAIASTFAILANGIITILFVPMILSLIGPQGTRLFLEKDRVTGFPGLIVRTFGLTKQHFPRLILVITAILCGFFLYHLSRLQVTNDPMSYFPTDYPLVRDINRLHADLSGVKFFFITLESEEDKAFQDPENIEKLVTIQDFLDKQGIFDRSISIADHLSLINREFNNGDPEYYKPPKKRELIAQYLLFFHRRDLESYVSYDFQRANIVVRHNVTDSNVLNRHIRELRDFVTKTAGQDMKSHVVGENLMVNAAAENLITAQIKSLIILLCVIFIIMSAMFTSFKGGIISLIPNLIPIIIMFGIMGILNIALNPGTAMVAVISIGIAIDGTIHLFSRYNELCRRTPDYEEAVDITIREEATPMVATYLALALGFGILLFSDFTLIAQFGALSAATMLLALFSNLLVTPIIMLRTRLIGLYQILSLSMHKEVLQKSPLFRGMTSYQIRKAILISEINEFEEGELLLKQGTFGRSMYLILTGQVEIIRRDDSRSRHITFLGPGQIFGEVGFIKEIQRTADVRASTHIEALRFDYERIRKDLKFFPHIIAKINFNISCVLGERLADTMNAISKENTASVVEALNHTEGI
ncbi:MAG: MMPL family transporter [Deltaproteobacteria bacterium]|nr:MMPL family transporter [Deltaproteobacteria bacterium]